jgi:phosphohistidine phosphatase
MKRLLLLRHAKAEPAKDPLTDIARPLAERGERDARRIGERARQHGLRPRLILASPAARALRTAELVAAAVTYPREEIVLERALYLAEPATIREIVSARDPRIDSVLVVGHNPGLTELVHELLPGFEVDDLPTGALVALDYADADWPRLKESSPRLAYYDFPKNVRAPVTAR